MATNFNNPKAISTKGEQIYTSKYRSEFEKEHNGKFVAIDVTTGTATLGETGSEAVFKAKADHPAGLFHLIRVGHAGAFEVGLSLRHANPDRLHRQ